MADAIPRFRSPACVIRAQGAPWEPSFGPFSDALQQAPVATASEVLLFALLMVHTSNDDAGGHLTAWINATLRQRSTYLEQGSAWRFSFGNTSVVYRAMNAAVTAKGQRTLEMIAGAMAAFEGEGRLVLAPPWVRLNAYLKKTRGSSRVFHAAVRVALLLEKTELRGGNRGSLMTLMIENANIAREPSMSSLTCAQRLREQDTQFEKVKCSMARAAAANVRHAVAAATSSLKAMLDDHAQSYAELERRNDELESHVCELEEENESIGDCAKEVQQRAARLVELAEQKTRMAQHRASLARAHRAKVTDEVRRQIALKEEEAVVELIADYDDKLRAARQQMREAQSEARANTTAAGVLAATRRVVRVRDARIDELEHELELEQQRGVEGRAALEKLAGVPDLSPTKERGRSLPSAMRKVCLHMLAFLTPPSAVVANHCRAPLLRPVPAQRHPPPDDLDAQEHQRGDAVHRTDADR